MNPTDALNEQIKAKKSELRELHRKSREIRVYIEALEFAVGLTQGKQTSLAGKTKLDNSSGSSPQHSKGTSAVPSQMLEDSVPGRIRALLKRHGKPMKIKEIRDELGMKDTMKAYNDVSSAVNWYARKGKVFKRIEPGLFGLYEWDTQPPFDLGDEDED